MHHSVNTVCRLVFDLYHDVTLDNTDNTDERFTFPYLRPDSSLPELCRRSFQMLYKKGRKTTIRS